MGCYFRVAFYGEKFNELNGVTMIYKEKPFTKLPEIAHRLQNMYYEQVQYWECQFLSVIMRCDFVVTGQFNFNEEYIKSSRNDFQNWLVYIFLSSIR